MTAGMIGATVFAVWMLGWVVGGIHHGRRAVRALAADRAGREVGRCTCEKGNERSVFTDCPTHRYRPLSLSEYWLDTKPDPFLATFLWPGFLIGWAVKRLLDRAVDRRVSALVAEHEDAEWRAQAARRNAEAMTRMRTWFDDAIDQAVSEADREHLAAARDLIPEDTR